MNENKIFNFIALVLYSFLKILQLECEKDSECNSKTCHYCLSTGRCQKYIINYCKDNECDNGDGGCGNNDQCPLNMSCGFEKASNFLGYHPLLKDNDECRSTTTSKSCSHTGKYS